MCFFKNWLPRFCWKRDKNILGLESVIGYRFRDTSLVRLALSHRSFVYSHQGTALDSNERLEFLGDSVLNLAVSEFLYRNHEQKQEGVLSQYKSLIISRKILWNSALQIQLGQFMLLSDSESRNGGRERSSILVDAFEALIAAIYLDRGYGAARQFILRYVLNGVEQVLGDRNFFNYKSILLEHFQGKGQPAPCYVAVDSHGPDHDKIFTIQVEMGEQPLGMGQGKTKKEAEQNAARDTLEKLGVLK